ncbi:unannotated protein [freshwater metagenome]|uniref:Unannotated protein n=1 Tax=freshwater metagenome TaxID=449393 RepID=A0A6J7IIA0_9ZZZZ
MEMRGAGAGESGDDDRALDLDVVDLGMTSQQIGQKEPVLQQTRAQPGG